MWRCRSTAAAAAAMLAVFGLVTGCSRSVPEGFNEYVVWDRLDHPTALAYAPDGRVFVAEKRGVVRVFDGVLDESSTEVVDLRTNVFNAGDRGLLDIAFSPAFPTDSALYALYTYDAPPGEEAPFWGQPGVNNDNCPTPPGLNTDGCVVSARLSRLPIVDGAWTGEEQVLLHDWCQQYPSHSIGTMTFASDGSLYVGGGDGASYTFNDYGQRGHPELNPCGDPPGGVGSVLQPPSAEGGSLRSQDLRTTADPMGLDGTIIRIDPATGDAMPDNPLVASPDPNTRRVVAYGVRNPFRFTLRPGTDELWIGDVGSGSFEEVNRSLGTDAVVDNFGWPCYEGPSRRNGMDQLDLSLCETLYAAEPGGVTAPWFTYRHRQPMHPDDRCPTDQGSSMSGLTFAPDDSAYLDEYDGALFMADASRGCVWVMQAGSDGLPDPATITPFVTPAGTPVELSFGPGGELWYVDHYGGRVVRVGYSASNRPPIPHATADPAEGDPPLTVDFDASGSSDPDPGDVLTFAWDFDDDGVFDDATGPTPSTTFTDDGFYVVRVRATDMAGASAVGLVGVMVGDPQEPEAVIQTPDAGTAAVGQTVDFSGFGVDPDGNLLPPEAVSWRVDLLHCPAACHRHDGVFSQDDVLAGSFVVPDHGFPAALELRMTVQWNDRTATATRRIDYRSTQVTFDSVPAGVSLSAGETTAPAPFTGSFSTNGLVTVTAPATATIDGVEHVFSSWSDGGARSHEIVVPADPATLTATFTPVAFTFADDFDDGDSAGWTASSGTWDICPAPGGAPGFGVCGAPPAGGIGIALADGPVLVDGVVEATVDPSDSGGKAALVARAEDTEHYYSLRLDDQPDDRRAWRLQRRDGDTTVTLATGTVTHVPGTIYRLRLTLDGDQLTAALSTDGGNTYTDLAQATDTTYTSGQIGLESRLRTNPFDSVTAQGQ